MAYDKLVDSAVLDATFTGIADAIREKTGITEKFSQDDMADKIAAVYDAGKQAEWSTFWDAFQNYGKRTGYAETFRSTHWNDTTFRPKYYPIVVTGTASNMFRTSGITFADPENPLRLDTSGVTTPSSMFYGCSTLENIGTLDFRNVTSLVSVFQQCTKLKSIKKIILKDDGSQSNSGSFGGCVKLKEIRFEGIIGQSGWNFSNCSSLSKESIESIINALSTTTNGLTLTLSRDAVVSVIMITPDDTWWNTLIGTKPNWTITLA